MIPGWLAPTVAAALTLVTSGVIGTTDAPAPPQAPTPAPAARAMEPSPSPPPTIAERFAQVRAEYDRRAIETRNAVVHAKDPREQGEIIRKMRPDDLAYCRRMVNLALDDPADLGARDALIWVANLPNRKDEGAYGDEFAHAAALLVRHHGDDPEAVRVGLSLAHLTSHHRDALFAGFLASAKGREAKALARMGMALYLTTKAINVDAARFHPGRAATRSITLDDNGLFQRADSPETDEDYADRINLALQDPAAMRSEAARLCREILADYADVPYLTTWDRDLEASLRQTPPTQFGGAISPDHLARLKDHLAHLPTLGAKAGELLEAVSTLVPGRPAPAIEGVDLAGKPLKLSDSRGKIVALVFWSSSTTPNLRELPRINATLAKYKDRPFAVLGVACDGYQQITEETVAREGVTWPQWFDGNPGSGSIAHRYHIETYPTVVVIDAAGNLRQTVFFGANLDATVAKLLDEMAAKPAP